MKNRDSHEDLNKNDLILVLNLSFDLPCGFCVVTGVNLSLLSAFVDETFCFCMYPEEVSFTASNNKESDLDDDVSVAVDGSDTEY